MVESVGGCGVVVAEDFVKFESSRCGGLDGVGGAGVEAALKQCALDVLVFELAEIG